MGPEDGSVDRVGSRREGGGTGRGLRPNLTSFPFLFCSGGLIPRAPRTARAEGGGSGRSRFSFPFVLLYGGSTDPLEMKDLIKSEN